MAKSRPATLAEEPPREPAPAATESILPVGPKLPGGSHVWDPARGAWLPETPTEPSKEA